VDVSQDLDVPSRKPALSDSRGARVFTVDGVMNNYEEHSIWCGGLMSVTLILGWKQIILNPRVFHEPPAVIFSRQDE
jgi:hypothetical protein